MPVPPQPTSVASVLPEAPAGLRGPVTTSGTSVVVARAEINRPRAEGGIGSATIGDSYRAEVAA